VVNKTTSDGELMIKLLIGPVSDLVGSWMKNKAEEKQAKHQAKMTLIQNDAAWETKMADASANSWKDEWFTILLSLPLLVVTLGVMTDDITVLDRLTTAFKALAELPDWYQYLLFIAVTSSFGIRGADKLMNLRKK
jgi:hypothetical protein